MSESVFQVIAQAKDGTVSKAAFSGGLFHIGSAPYANLKLTGDNMPAIALRLQRAQGDGVMVTNLVDGAPAPMLDSLGIPSMESKGWKTGQIIKLGDYVLRLEGTGAVPTPTKDELGDIPTVRPGKTMGAVTQPSAAPASLPEAVDEGATADEETPVAAARNKETPRPSVVPEAVDEGATADEEPRQIAARSNAVTNRPGRVPEVSQFVKVPVQDEQATAAFIESNFDDEDKDKDKEFATAAYNGPIATLMKEIAAAPQPDFNSGGYTLRKDWQEVGKLGAQLGLQSINFMPGERIVIPVSIRNDYTHDVQLLITGAGIPLDWKLVVPTPVKVKSGEIQAVDLVLETHPTALTNLVEAIIRLYDQVTPTLAINLPLTMILKRHPDMIGQLEPVLAHENQPIYLTLRNYTLAKTDVFVSGQSSSGAIRVVIPHPKAELPPNQTLRLPIKIEVLKRSRLFDTQHPYQLAVQQGTRAPLNYSGSIRVRPRMGYLPLFLFLLVSVVAVVLIGLALLDFVQSRFIAAVPPTPTPTSTAIPTMIASREFIVPAFTPEFVPSPEPILPTAIPFVDPRPTTCQASVPEGWQPYVVVSGDTLYRLASRTKTTIGEIMRVNCLPNSQTIFRGQILLLPG